MGRRSPAGVRRTKHGRPEATKLVDHVFIEAMALAAPLDLRIAWIPRSWNLQADDLAGKLIDC
jgi:hypothetical protein